MLGLMYLTCSGHDCICNSLSYHSQYQDTMYTPCIVIFYHIVIKIQIHFFYSIISFIKGGTTGKYHSGAPPPPPPPPQAVFIDLLIASLNVFRTGQHSQYKITSHLPYSDPKLDCNNTKRNCTLEDDVDSLRIKL